MIQDNSIQLWAEWFVGNTVFLFGSWLNSRISRWGVIYDKDHLFFLASTKESLDIKRRHAFMLAGTLLNEYSDLAAAALEFNFHRLICEIDVATETNPKMRCCKNL